MDDSTVPSKFPPDPAPSRSLPNHPFHGASQPLQPPPPYSSFYGMTFGQTLERILHLLRVHWKPLLGSACCLSAFCLRSNPFSSSRPILPAHSPTPIRVSTPRSCCGPCFP